MLKIYEELFHYLNQESLNYVIYKGLAHLHEDLYGERKNGDIDILIEKNSEKLFNKYMNKGLDGKQKYSFIGLDIESKKTIWIDFDYRIKSGHIPYKPYYFNIELNKLKTTKFENITILANEEYIPLMFIMRVTGDSDKKENLKELQYLLQNTKVNGYIQKIAENLAETKWEEIEKDILNSISWYELKAKYKKNIFKNMKIDIESFIFQKFRFFIGKYKTLKINFFKYPPYRIRKKGCLVAFIGVDGAGKSTTIEYIQKLEYFQYTGVKRVYFGNNEYWIPGLQLLLKKEFKNRFLKLFLSTFALIDRQLRILLVLYYIKLGNIVLADRYIYDDEISRAQNKDKNDKKPFIKKVYQKIFAIRMWKKPNLTIFLDVSPDVAYSRKQDYSFNQMLTVNRAYKNYMYKVSSVKIINADESQEKVYNEVVNAILDLTKC